MLDITVILLLFFLASQLLTVSLGIDFSKSKGMAVLYAGLLSISQALLLFLGFSLGEAFMHLLKEFKNIVIFAALFLIGIRMLMESYQVWKGLRTYNIDSFRIALLAGLAQGVNAFLVGMIFVFLPFQKIWLTLVLFIFSLIISISGSIVKPVKNSITFAALLFVLGGIWLLISSIYLGFFAIS